MTWYDESIFYHIYPLGLCGCPKQNDYGQPVSRIKKLDAWIDHIVDIGCNAIYIGPLFESVGHGYETTDYKKLDSRLGTNQDLKDFVKKCHNKGVHVIFDGVFNHTGRDFFAFKDIQQNRENSRYRDWYCDVNFSRNNSYNDGFSYTNWGGYDLLVKLNQRNRKVQEYIRDVIFYWVKEFDVDGIRLDAADVLDFEFMKMLRQTANEVKQDFWLMGEVIHGDYSRWVNDDMLHSVTNYQLHKALYSGHNSHNYFEIAHTINRFLQNNLYNFVDNHDVERIYSKLTSKSNYMPVNVLLYTIPGIPSLYYGSEFGIEGKKMRYSDDSLRPCLNLEDFKDNAYVPLFRSLGKVRQNIKALTYGSYKQLELTTTKYAFSRTLDQDVVIVALNNERSYTTMTLPCQHVDHYVGCLSHESIKVENGMITIKVPANSGEIWIPDYLAGDWMDKNIVLEKIKKQPAPKKAVKKEEAPKKKEVIIPNKSYEEMTVEELQAVILQKMANNGPVTDQMKKTVYDNIWHNSLVNWAKSFR